MKFSNKEIGNNTPVFIVLEAGPTHYSLESALALVDVAADSGADAIKFQIGSAKKLIPDPTVMFTYTYLKNKATGETEEVTESLQEILLRRELSEEEWKNIAKHCKEKNITFFATVFDVDNLPLLWELGVECVKIFSADINYHYLLREAAKYDWIVQIDTGGATIAEVEQAIFVLEEAKCNKIIINHCPSGYPAHLESINLNVLTTLKQMFDYPIAFSDHNPGSTMDIAATALGVNMLEKTITLDRTIKSPEHIMSLEPDEVKSFVQTIREVEIALGKKRRFMSQTEKEKSKIGRRSIYAGEDIKKGAELTQKMFHYARPEKGVPAHLDYLLLGRTANRDIKKGELILLESIQ